MEYKVVRKGEREGGAKCRGGREIEGKRRCLLVDIVGGWLQRERVVS